jgi:hypothetical protein
VWRQSTEESVDNIFGSKAIKLCPPTKGSGNLLTPLAHFINCHGAETDPNFYGQRGKQYPVSMTSDDVSRGAKRSTLVAAECCFGAQLYDPNDANGKWPIANAYLGAGAAAFFGSTTIAYGPAKGNGSADLLTQYFLIDTFAGASIGRACLQARQKFVLEQKMEDPVNLKTLAQFVLLGDPSLQPCPTQVPDAKELAEFVDESAARKMRRVALVAAGKAAADSSGFPGKRVARRAKKLHGVVQKLARQRGFRARSQDLAAFHVVGGGTYGKELKARGVEQKVLMLVEEHKTGGAKAVDLPKGLRNVRILVAHAQDNRVTSLTEYAIK